MGWVRSMAGRGQRFCVVMPTFNSGDMLARTVGSALCWLPDVVVVVDGSTDGSRESLRGLESKHPGLRVLEAERNRGKGAAALEGMARAAEEGFTHGIVMDSDGQHPAERIPQLVEVSRREPEAMVLGRPIFGADAPAARVYGRWVGNFFANVETLWGGVGDSLFGFRLYPLEPALRVMGSTRWGRGFDFDTELVVRLFWEGIRPMNVWVPVYYPKREAGGVTHFRYVRDNWLLAGTHCRLMLGLLPRLGKVWKWRRKWARG